ncbi:hypothetical protein [Paenibacillus lautus]|nr:hypothetical protein [Paenibacillus lautus]
MTKLKSGEPGIDYTRQKELFTNTISEIRNGKKMQEHPFRPIR